MLNSKLVGKKSRGRRRPASYTAPEKLPTKISNAAPVPPSLPSRTFQNAAPAEAQTRAPAYPTQRTQADGAPRGRDGQAGGGGGPSGGGAGRRRRRWRASSRGAGAGALADAGGACGSTVPGEDVRAGGGPGDGRRGVVGRGAEQLRGVGPARLRRGAPPAPLQARQLLHLPPAAQHLRAAILQPRCPSPTVLPLFDAACPLLASLGAQLVVPRRSSIWRALELDSTAAEFDSWENSSIRRRRSSISSEESARRADLRRRAPLSPGFHLRCQAGVGAEGEALPNGLKRVLERQEARAARSWSLELIGVELVWSVTKRGPHACSTTSGFRKVSPDRWEFAHADFLASQCHLLPNIRRRRGGAGGSTASATSSGAKIGASGSGGRERELERLRRDREALARELVRLRRGQQEARAQLLDMERRVRGTERRQEQFTAFLACAIEIPGFLERRGSAALVEAGRKRRLLDAAADVLAFEELALAASSEVEAATVSAVAAVSQDSGSTSTATDMIWYELLGEEQVGIDAEVEELVVAAAASEVAEPWEEMGDEEVEELVQQIGCLSSPSP
ncbi:glycine, alanine and asparagine-rich protein-like isoform X1 [Panicum virgatum]|uniref:Uncharacterized protein n=1 Tax=Panicum virgatum TaxID=38727 RepID=A0A8T0TC32_PANVG|nr:glycine, alanine and asparagine-rich protein-like isoform X1 [Panicum virgatum]KAG2606674.1 hypothetical protein PVAP13_4NG211743 [Panicum virgatum]